jgi:hypothetical protein
VAQHYSYAKSYYIVSVEERATTTEYSRHWKKTLLNAAVVSETATTMKGARLAADP